MGYKHRRNINYKINFLKFISSFYSILIIMEAFVLLNFYPFVKNR
jgi:hypothetical protein